MVSSESEPHSQLESGFGSLSPRSQPTPEESPQEDSSVHSVRDSGIRNSAILKHPLQVSHQATARVTNQGQLNSTAANFPSTYKPSRPSPVTFVIGGHSSPATSPPVCSPLLSTEPPTELVPPQRSYPHLKIAELQGIPEDDTALSKTFAIDDAMGYPHEHTPGQNSEVAQAVSSTPLPSASHRNSVSCVERSASQHSVSSPISVTPSQAEVNMPRQASASSVSSASSNASGLIMNASGTADPCSSTCKDLSAIPPKPYSWTQGILKVYRKMKGKIVSEEVSIAKEEEYDAPQYVVGLGIKM